MYNQLNSEQKKAVLTKSKSTLVVAGAGSGKTRVITTRIAHLIEAEKQDPSKIVCLTFTNKAAKEMKERLNTNLPNLEKYPYMGTFHSFCLYLMRSNPKFFPENFSIIDDQDQASLISRIIKDHGMGQEIKARKAMGVISRYKNSLEKTGFFRGSPVLEELFEKYEIEKEKNFCLDFDDLLLKVLDSLTDNPDFATKIGERFSHILIDEYQDTNHVQHDLISKIALCPKGKMKIETVFAVGDQDQSIYSWRGAAASNMDKFSKQFKKTEVFKLERNYRSVQPILQLANSVISENENRIEKNLWTDQGASNRIIQTQTYDEYREAEMVAHTAGTFLKKVSDGELSILIRAHFQSRILEEKMIEEAIPYKIVGSLKFYDRKEIRDCLALLRFCANPADKQSFSRIIGFAVKGLGSSFVKNLFDFFNQSNSTSLLTSLETVIEEKPFKTNKTQTNSIESLVEFFAGLDRDCPPSMCLEKLVNRTGYRDILTDQYPAEEAAQRSENIQELIKASQRFELKATQQQEAGLEQDPKKPTLSDYLQEVSLVQDQDDVEGQNPVLIMTMHTAKGLEFDNVIIPGVEEGVVPYKRAEESHAQIEEERRLFYVGITRAKKRLILSTCSSRNHYGKRMASEPSRFLDKADPELVQTVHCQDPTSTGQGLGKWLSGDSFDANSGDFMSQSSYSSFIPARVKSEIEKKAKSEPKVTPAVKAQTRTFRKGTLVRHEKFGLGVVHAAKKQTDGQLCLTVAFGKDHKKVLSRFLQTIRV